MQHLKQQDPAGVLPNKIQNPPTRGLDALARVFLDRIDPPLPEQSHHEGHELNLGKLLAGAVTHALGPS